MCVQVDKQEVVRQKKKYEKTPKTMLLSGHPIPATVSNKALNQYDFPSSEEEPSSQVHGLKLSPHAFKTFTKNICRC